MKYIITGVCFFMWSTVSADPVARDTVITYYSISPTAFVAARYDHPWQRIGYSLWTLASPQAMFSPVYLPDSARVIEFTVWVRDNNPSNGMIIDFNHSLLDASGTGIMAQVYSTPNGGLQELADTTISNDIIDNENYMYHVQALFYAPDSSHQLYGIRITYETYTSSPFVEEHVNPEPGSSSIPKAHPIPFSHETAIEYSVLKHENVSLKIYDQAGRLVRILVDDIITQGYHTARWDGKDQNNNDVAAGSYFCVIKTNGSSATKILKIK